MNNGGDGCVSTGWRGMASRVQRVLIISTAVQSLCELTIYTDTQATADSSRRTE